MSVRILYFILILRSRHTFSVYCRRIKSVQQKEHAIQKKNLVPCFLLSFVLETGFLFKNGCGPPKIGILKRPLFQRVSAI